jgi:hypothetical protein
MHIIMILHYASRFLACMHHIPHPLPQLSMILIDVHVHLCTFMAHLLTIRVHEHKTLHTTNNSLQCSLHTTHKTLHTTNNSLQCSLHTTHKTLHTTNNSLQCSGNWSCLLSLCLILVPILVPNPSTVSMMHRMPAGLDKKE